MKIALYLLGILLLEGCSLQKTTTVQVTRVPAKFDYSPPNRATAGANNMTVALLRPVYITKNLEYYASPFSEMSTSMANDFEELLTAKGFKIRGPFRSRDEMVYGDKINSDFAFTIEIDLKLNYNRKYNYDQGIGTIVPASYRMYGDVTLIGNLLIVASSARYGEKIWNKNIALDRTTFNYTGSVKWTVLPTIYQEIKEDNELYNNLARELESFYSKAMNLAWQQIDPAEMKAVAEQAKMADTKQ